MCDTSIISAADVCTLAGFRQGHSWVIAVRGELDISCDAAIRDGFTQAANGSCDRVVVDASGVTFVDCGGLRALYAASTACAAEVWLRSPSPPVLRLAELAGLAEEWRRAISGDEVRIACPGPRSRARDPRCPT